MIFDMNNADLDPIWFHPHQHDRLDHNQQHVEDTRGRHGPTQERDPIGKRKRTLDRYVCYGDQSSFPVSH